MKRAYKISLKITKSADIWVLADSEESAKEVVEQEPQRIEGYHYDSDIEEPECIDECCILEVPDGEPLYDEDLNEIGYEEFERLKTEAIEEESLRIEAIEEVFEERRGE